MEDIKVDRRTKAYRDAQLPTIEMSNPQIMTGDSLEPVKDIPEDNVVFDEVGVDYSDPKVNIGWSKCFKCGVDLEPNDDGSPKFRKFAEACPGCVKKNYGKAIIDGKVVDIDPTDPPKVSFKVDKWGNEKRVVG